MEVLWELDMDEAWQEAETFSAWILGFESLKKTNVCMEE